MFVKNGEEEWKGKGCVLRGDTWREGFKIYSNEPECDIRLPW